MNKVASYIGNMGKSVGFMAVDAVKGYNETASEFVAQNSELFKEIYSGIKNYRTTLKRTGRLLKQSTIYDSGNRLINNIFDDIRTGNLYNKQRMEKYDMEALGMDEFDVGSNAELDTKDATEIEISAEDKRASHTEGVIEMASAEAANMVASTTAKTGQYIVANMQASDQMRRVENSQLVHSLATGFGSVQAGIARVLDFANGPLVTHMQNSAKYYENSIKLMQEQNAMFKEFLEMQREQYKAQLEEENKKKRLGYDDIVGANGTPDLKAYAKLVGGNAKNMLSEFGMDMLLGDGLGGKKGSMLNAMLANPIGALGTMAIKALIPEVLKNTAESFNESLQGLFGTIIGRFNRMAKQEGSIASIIGKLFGIRNTLKEDVSAGQFKKGPVPFDGITRNAIINIIPSHLRRIEAALTNKDERVFDNETGKWSTAKDINEKYEAKKKSFRDEAVGDVEKEMHDYIKRMGIMDRAEEQKLLKGMSDLLTRMYKDGGTFNFSKKGLDGSDYGIDDQELFNNLMSILNASAFKTGGKRGNAKIRQMDKNIINARNKSTKWANETSMDAASAYMMIASGDIDPKAIKRLDEERKSKVNFNPTNPLQMLDKDGNSAYYYMRTILAELRIHRQLLANSYNNRARGGGNTTNQVITINGQQHNIGSLDDSDVDRLVRSAGETSERMREIQRESVQADRHREKAGKVNQEMGWNSEAELNAAMLRDRMIDLRIRQEMEERRDARSRDSGIIQAGRRSAENYEKRKRAAKNGKGTFMDQLIAAGSLGEKMEVIKGGLSTIAQKPAQMLQSVIESADTHLYNFFFGDQDETDEDGNPIKGFMGKMTKELRETFSKLNEWLNEKLLKPLMEKLGIKTWEDVPRKIVDLFGGEGTYDRLKKNAGDKLRAGLKPYGEAIKSAFGRAKDDVKDAFSTARDDYYRLRGIPKPGELSAKEQRKKNIIDNDKTGYRDIIRNLNENQVAFKSDKARKNYITAAALKAQGHNIDMSLLNSDKEEDWQKFQDQISAARTENKKSRKDADELEQKKVFAQKALSRRAHVDKYIADNGLDSQSFYDEYDKLSQEIKDIEAAGGQVTKKQKKEFAALEKKAKMISEKTKELKTIAVQAEKEYQDFAKTIGKNPSEEDAKTLKQLLAKKTKAYSEYIMSLRGDVARGTKMLSEEQEKMHIQYGTKAYARGARYITKSGITAISEGEMIIPSELNPYNPYRIATNKAAEIANEEAIRSRFSKRLANLISRRVHKNAEGDDPVTPAEASQAVGADRAAEKIVRPDSVIGTLEKGVSTVAYRLFGKDGQSQEEFSGMMSGMMGQIKDAAPDAVGNGLLGGTLGLLIGGPGAIMLGAAAGAAKGIISKSEGLQNMLFGQVGEDGEREGGMISKQFQQNFKKYFPDMKSYGIVGGLTLFPFLGPIGGILAGSALGFAKNNDTFQNYLFGEINPETGKRDLEDGLIGGANKEKLKKAFPAIGAGAIAGMFLGPFGIIGNAAFGAGAGMLSTTDKFKDIVLGKENEQGEREGGILGAIRTGIIDPIKDSFEGFKNRIQEFIEEDILEPLREFMDPFAQGAKNFFGSLLKTVGHGINKLFENTLGIPLDRLIKEKVIEPATKGMKFLLKAVTAPLRAVVSAPFKFLGGIGNSIRKGQVKKGTAYDMTADERLKYRATHSMFKLMGKKVDDYKNADKVMANWFIDENGNKIVKGMDGFDERAKDLTDLAQNANDAAFADEDYFIKKKNELKGQTSSKISDWFADKKKDTKADRRIRNRILSFVNKGDLERASEYLRMANLAPSEARELQEVIDEATREHATFNETRNRILGDKGARDQIKEELSKRFGIKNVKDKDVSSLAKYLNTELKANGLDKVKANLGEDGTGKIAEILTDKDGKLADVIASGLEQAMNKQHKKLEDSIKERTAKGAERYGIALDGEAKLPEGMEDFLASSGDSGMGRYLLDSITGDRNLLQRSNNGLLNLTGDILHLANTPLRVLFGMKDYAGNRIQESKRQKSLDHITNTLSNNNQKAADTQISEKLMSMWKDGDFKDISFINEMSEDTEDFRLTPQMISMMNAMTKRQVRHSKKAGKTKGFEDLYDLEDFKNLSKREREYIMHFGKRLQGGRSEDIANLSGRDLFAVKEGAKFKDLKRGDIEEDVETNALGGIIGKAVNATKAFGNKVKSKFSAISANEIAVDPKTKESKKMLDQAKEEQQEQKDLAAENVEVDKEQTNVLKQISSQLKDVWKTQDMSLRTKITETGKVIKIGIGKDGTPQASSDKSSVEAIKEEQENRGIMRRLADGVTGFGEKIGNFLGFNKDDDDDNKETWFDKIKGTLLKVLGGATIAAAAGHAANTWDTTIKPWIESTAKPWIAEKLKAMLQNPESPAWKIASKLDEFFANTVGWIQGSGKWKGSQWSLPGIIKGYGTWMQTGIQFFFEKVIPKGVELFVRVLPNLVVGIVKGIKNGLGYLFSKWFKKGGYKGDDTIDLSIPKIGEINPNSKPFTNKLCGLAGTEISSIVPSYNTEAVNKVISINDDGEVTEALTSDDKMGGVLDILNGNMISGTGAGTGVDFDGYDSSTKIGGYTMEELTSGTMTQSQITKAVRDFSKSEGLSDEQEKNILSILSANTVRSDDEIAGMVRDLLKKNKNGTTAQKRKAITSIMAIIRNEPGYYDTNSFDDDDTEELYDELLKISYSTEYRSEENRINDIKNTTLKKLDTVKKDYGLNKGTAAVAAGIGRRVLTGGIQNGKVAGKLVKGVSKATSGIKFIGTGSKAVNKAAKGSEKLMGSVDNLGRKFTNFGDKAVLKLNQKTQQAAMSKFESEAMEAGMKASKEAREKALNYAATKGLGEETAEKFAKNLASSSGEKAANAVMEKAGTKSLQEGAEGLASRIAKNSVDDVVEGAAKKGGLISKFIAWAGKNIKKILTHPKVVAMVNKMGGKALKEGAESLMKQASEKVSQALMKVLSTKLAKAGVSVLTKITSVLGTGGTITLVFAVGDFISGCLNAESIMGVTKDQEISWGQRLCAGLVKCANGFVTLGIVPENILYDLFIDTLGPALGFDTTSMQEMREEAQKQLDEYNLEHDTNLTMEEYNKKNSWWGKTKDKIGEGAKWVGSKIAGGAKNVVKGAKDLAVKAGTAIATKTKEIVGGALDIGTFIKDVTTNVIKSATDPEYHWNIDNYIKEDDPLGGAKKTIYQVLKIPLGIVGIIAKIGKPIYDKVKAFVSDVKDGSMDAFTDIANVAKGQYTIFSGDYWKFNQEAGSEENPLSIISKISGSIIRFYGIAPAMLGYVSSKALERIKKIISGAKEGALDASTDIANVAKGQYTIFSGEYWKSDNTNDGNPLSTLGKISAFVTRVYGMAPAMLGYVGSKAWGGIKKIISGAKEGALDASEDIAAVSRGEYTIFSGEYWKSDEEDDGNPLSTLGKISGSIIRFYGMAPAMLGYVSSKALERIKKIISGAKEGALDASTDIANVAKGQYTIFSGEYWKSDEEDDGNPLSTLGKISAFVTRVYGMAPAMLGYVTTKAVNKFKEIVNGAKDTKDTTDKIIDKAKKGDISVFSAEYWKMDDVKDNPLGLIGIISSFIQRLAEAPVVIFTKVFGKIKEKFDDIKGWFSKLFGEDAEVVDTDSGKGHPKGSKRTSKYGKGKVSQLDPEVSGISYNGNTIGEAGCGPVAAANVINNIRGTDNVSVQDAADFAVRMGYKQKNDGTNPRYMNSILSASGIDNQNISGRGSIRSNLTNGNPVIIMGQGHSDQSPYGKYNPHYITAMGYDPRGNIIVDDPYESGYTTYSESAVMNGIMNSTAVGRNGFGKSRRGRRRFGFGRFGMGKLTDAQLTALTKKAFEITNKAEGNYDTVIPNDNGSWSVGIAGFHGAAKIKPLFEDMASKLSGTARTQALKFAGWGPKILSSAEAAEVKAFLNANQAVSKEVQDRHLSKHIQENNFATAIKMYEAGELLDPRSIVLIGDIANTGPGHVDTWRKVHTKASSADTDLQNTRDSLKSKSFWANPSAKCAKYRTGWLNRIDNTYNILKDWDGVSVSGGGSSSDGNSNSSSGQATLFTALSDLGTNMMKSIYGEDIYEAVFGSQQQPADSSRGSSDGSINTSEVKKLDGTVVNGPVSSNEHVRKAQIAIANKMYSREGKNSYSQNGALREKQGTSNSDCSSMVSWAYRQALGSDDLTNKLMGSTLPGWSGYTGSQWERGTLIDTNKNSSKFQVGDLLFWGSGGKTSHVEMYTGQDTIMGHGSDIGPTEKKLSTYQHSKAFMGGRRYIDEDIAKQAGYGKGRGGFGKAIIGSRTTDNARPAQVVNLRPSYGATTQAIAASMHSGSETVERKSQSNYIELLKIVIQALNAVAGNTEKITLIYDILAKKLGVDTSEMDNAENKARARKEKVDSALRRLETRSTFDGNTPEVSDSDLEAILQMMTAIARE